MADRKKKVNLVLEGGGMKGLAFIGALMELEQEFEFMYLAGSSAGALVSTLLAFGKTSSELFALVDDDEFFRSIRRNRNFISRIPIIGPLWNLFKHKGLYDGSWIEEKIRQEISRGYNTPVSFYDLDPPNKLTLMVADVTEKRAVAFPEDWVKWGLKYDTLDAAFAARCSMSIPFYFYPMQKRIPPGNGQIHYFVDGGMLSNLPYWYLDAMIPDSRQYPTIGVILDEGSSRKPIRSLGDMIKATFLTMLSPLDQRNLEDPDFIDRTMRIDVRGVSTLDFDLTKEKREKLIMNGREEARRFLRKFNYEQAVYEDSQAKKAREKRVSLTPEDIHLSGMTKVILSQINKRTFHGKDAVYQQLRNEFASEVLKILSKGLDDPAAESIWKAGYRIFNQHLSRDFSRHEADKHIEELLALNQHLTAVVNQIRDEGGKSKARSYINICIENIVSMIRRRAEAVKI